jgi:hypothetical protein
MLVRATTGPAWYQRQRMQLRVCTTCHVLDCANARATAPPGPVCQTRPHGAGLPQLACNGLRVNCAPKVRQMRERFCDYRKRLACG